ncbi:uncharacterized protein LOC134532133 isoform X2 [Bacillus rossius redtenbacheri]|uniref:uncharacterized protein LOC134532133 isoform X2 n=1 Tax=Bacillus rossius redtenbacheri TaxID=93214 RepID=UPI002FDD0341
MTLEAEQTGDITAQELVVPVVRNHRRICLQCPSWLWETESREAEREFGPAPAGAAETTCSLESDLAELVSLFPSDEYSAVLGDYLRHDEAYRRAHDYLGSEAFAELFARVRLSPEYRAYLDEAGYPGLLNLGEHHEPPPRPPRQPRAGTGFHGLVGDVISALPLDRTRDLFARYMSHHECFRTFVNKVQGPEFQALLTSLDKAAEYGEFKAELLRNGIDLHDVYHLYEQVLGFEIFSIVEEPWDRRRVQTEL